MALQIIAADSIGAGIRVTLTGGDDLIVASGTAVGSTDNIGVYGAGNNHAANIQGLVSGATAGIQLGNDPLNDSGNFLFVTEGGTIGGSTYGALLRSNGSALENFGTIMAESTAVRMQGDAASGQSTLYNAGLIDGGSQAINHIGTEALVLVNEGLIRSVGSAYVGSGIGQDLITNTGRIVGSVSLGDGNDLYDGQNGRHNGGNFEGGTGDDTLIGGIDDDQLHGGADNDILRGNGGNDQLNGNAGLDRMFGGLGDDLYFVDNAGDVVDETGGNGIDTVLSSISFNLSDAIHAIGAIENLTLIGTGAVGIGNVLANRIEGTVSADLLDGLAGNDLLYGFDGADTLKGGLGNDLLDGGTEADHLLGGIGNDVYVVDNAGDIVNEIGGSGIDTVLASVSFSLADAVHARGAVERLTLTGTAAYGVGNGLANILVGNAAGNLLLGLGGNDSLAGAAGNDKLAGGLGNDLLTGGANADVFVFNTAPNAATNRDVIADFSHVDDTIQLENAIFTRLGAAGALNPGFFFAGAAAHDANDYIVYNPATGALFYDANGNAAGGAVQFAILANKPVLAADDFSVI